MKRKSIVVALIIFIFLLSIGLSSNICCTPVTPPTQYTLTMTIASASGGSVTPAVGAHTYTAGTVVNLVATPDSGYRFVNWTTTAGTFGNATAATTTFTMPTQDATVTAHFALGTIIANVPDTNQPPTQTLPSSFPLITNYCAPTAMVNVLKYWDVPTNINAYNVTAGLAANTTAEYLGYFMNTNNQGSPARPKVAHSGTYNTDIPPGTMEFARWDNAHKFATPPPNLPNGKLGYDWAVTMNCFGPTDHAGSLNFYEGQINNGRPLVVSFTYWNLVSTGISVTDPQSGENITVFSWNTTNPGFSAPPNPEEYWTTGQIGHAVTGVGYILNWNPTNSGTPANYVIVHDTWATTPENVAIPWANWMCLFAVDPGSYEHITP